MENISDKTAQPPGDGDLRKVSERAILVGLQFDSSKYTHAAESLDELKSLAKTAGAEVVGSFIQKREAPDRATLIGRGKMEELQRLVEEDEADVVIFDSELTPSQQRNIEEKLDRKVLDRTALILDIFAQHAHSLEGKSQVEMAQMKYLLSRLSGKGVQLSRLGGGIGTRGPGETKLEVDRRRIRQRIQTLNRELARLSNVRRSKRKHRTKMGIPAISIVGYTNAGKSSLLNALTGADALVEDQLFSTLDTTVRRITMQNRVVVLGDTVGFINNLPHQLIEAFKSTLEEVLEADLVLHVIDASSETMSLKTAAVDAVLEEIGAGPLPQLRVFNKTDLLPREELEGMRGRYPDAAFVSAKRGTGLEELKDKLASRLLQSREISVLIPYERGDLLALVQRSSVVLRTKAVDAGVEVEAQVPPYLVHVLAPFRAPKGGTEPKGA